MLPQVYLAPKATLYLVILRKIISPKVPKPHRHSARLEISSKLMLDLLDKQVNFNKIKVLINNKMLFLGRHNQIYFNNQDLVNKKP